VTNPSILNQISFESWKAIALEESIIAPWNTQKYPIEWQIRTQPGFSPSLPSQWLLLVGFQCAASADCRQLLTIQGSEETTNISQHFFMVARIYIFHCPVRVWAFRDARQQGMIGFLALFRRACLGKHELSCKPASWHANLQSTSSKWFSLSSILRTEWDIKKYPKAKFSLKSWGLSK
jgi:hypothetical protein